jgi:glycosyltransferase involved in cell wall biosynthesis
MNVLLVSPDTTENPFGGMGVQMKGLQSADSPINFKFHYVETHSFQEQDSASKMKINGRLGYYGGNYDHKKFTVDSLYSQLLNFPDISKLKDIDIVNSFDASTGMLGYVIAKALGVPHVWTLQLSNIFLLRDVHGIKGSDYFKMLELKCMQHAHAIVHGSMEYAKEFYYLNNNVYTIKCGIEFDKWQSIKKDSKSLPGRKNAKKLCYIGRITTMKNVQSLMQTKLPEDVDLYFIGHHRAGSEFIYEHLKDFVKENKNVHFLGPIYGDEKIKTLKKMDAVIVPSIHEPFGIVTLEALASNNILLSSFKSGMGEYLNEDVAINCGVTPDEISKAILKWSKMTSKQINDQIKRGHEFLKPFTWENSAATLHEIYKRTIKQYNILKEHNAESNNSPPTYDGLTKLLNNKNKIKNE